MNPATGFPWATGPMNLNVPFNHLLPAWDAITGTLAATGLLAAERHRARTGEGQLVRLALSDVAFAMVGNLGKIAEVQINHDERPKYGNYLYGAFGRDFATRDGKRIMVVALTMHQWDSLCAATDLHDAFAVIEARMGLDFAEEGDRFRAREVIAAILKPWIITRPLDEVRAWGKTSCPASTWRIAASVCCGDSVFRARPSAPASRAERIDSPSL